MKESNMNKIDAVITWVDGNDPEWRRERNQYMKIKYQADIGEVRYRDWDNLQYIFRGIEKYMPWINVVHFVTWGHIPGWMNTSCEKLHIVGHKEFIPKEYLPTFNSNVIELNIHRIPGLAEQYLNFNDDMFVVGNTRPEDFFDRGLPKDSAILSPQPLYRGGIANIVVNNLEILNDYYSMEDVLNNKKKWFSPIYKKMLIRNIIFSRFKTIIGIYENHIPFSHLKATADEVWKKEFDILDSTCRNKFRSKEDVNEWLIRGWQLLSGNFIPRRCDFGKLVTLSDEISNIIELLRKPGSYKMICLNDNEKIIDFEEKKERLKEMFNVLFPEKSMFEI